MDKMTKKIILSFCLMVCAAALILGVYYMISQGKISSARNNTTPSGEVEKLLAKDLEDKYPETPTEVVKLYWRFTKCIYNNSMSDENFTRIVKQMRILYDEELLSLEANQEQNMITQFKKEKTAFLKDKQSISTYAVQKNSTVAYGQIKGKECATVISGTLTKQKSTRKQTYEKFLCRKDEKGHWRIVGWEQTTNQEEIATLGDNS